MTAKLIRVESITAFDPGLMTGIARIDLGDDRKWFLTHMSWTQNISHTLISDERMRDNQEGRHQFVIERYVGAGTLNKHNVATIERVGMIKLFALLHNIEYAVYTSKQRTTYLNAAKDMFKQRYPNDPLTGDARHAIDALAHALRFATHVNADYYKANPDA